jgi:hypothetical protein
VQIKLIARFSILLSVLISLFCFVALTIGRATPTPLIVAQMYSYLEERQYLALIDVNRNLPFRYNFPVNVLGNIYISDDGRRMVLPTGEGLHQAVFVLWEASSGKLITLPDYYVNCSARNWGWLSDNRHVLFQCRDNPQDGTIGGMYTMDFETGDIYPLYNNPSVIMPHQWSSDNTRVAINDNGKVYLVGVHGDNLTDITPQGRRFTFIAWLPDGESVLLRGLRSIERYTLATGELDLILDDFETSILPVLAPNGESLALVSNERLLRAYALNLTTGDLTLLETNELKINNVQWIGWSPDSQWVMIDTPHPTRQGNIYYLARPDASLVMVLAEGVERSPKWSADSQQVSFTTYNTPGNTPQSAVMVWELNSFLPPKAVSNYANSPHWSSIGDDLAFIRYEQTMQLGYRSASGEVRLLTNTDESVVGFRFVK